MIRRLVALVAAGALLGACGTTQTPAAALRDWVAQSNFAAALATLRSDARHSATALRDPTSSPNDLHTVCAVLSQDANSAGAALPTPDHQSTVLLGRAYVRFSVAANQCYGAGRIAARRADALTSLEGAMSALAEAAARVAAAS